MPKIKMNFLKWNIFISLLPVKMRKILAVIITVIVTSNGSVTDFSPLIRQAKMQAMEILRRLGGVRL